MAGTPQVHNSTNSQVSSSMSGEGSHDAGSNNPSHDSNMASVTVTSTVSSPSGSGTFVPNSTMPITTMAFHTVSSGYRPVRPPRLTTNPLYGPIPPPTLGFHTVPSFEPDRYTPPRVTP
jgi:hypothetical protein